MTLYLEGRGECGGRLRPETHFWTAAPTPTPSRNIGKVKLSKATLTPLLPVRAQGFFLDRFGINLI